MSHVDVPRSGIHRTRGLLTSTVQGLSDGICLQWLFRGIRSCLGSRRPGRTIRGGGLSRHDRAGQGMDRRVDGGMLELVRATRTTKCLITESGLTVSRAGLVQQRGRVKEQVGEQPDN